MATLDLPYKDSEDIQLVIATPEENVEQLKATCEAFGGILSTEAHVRRRQHLYRQDLMSNGRMSTWVLVHQPNGEQRQVLCGCETIKKRALVAKDGVVKEVVAQSICAVYCPEKYRRKGYAGRMMNEIRKRMRTWQVENRSKVAFSILFSGIGKEYYASFGWQPVPCTHISLTLASASLELSIDLLEARPLQRSHLESLCLADEKLIRTRLERVKDSGRTTIVLVPDKATIEWHHARENFVAGELGWDIPQQKGAIVGNDEGSRVWCYWTLVWHSDTLRTLYIMRLVIEGQNLMDEVATADGGVAAADDTSVVQAIAALFRSALKMAAEWNMVQVQIWNPSSVTLAAARLLDSSATVEPHEHDIPSLLWYGEEPLEKLDWLYRERYPWC